MNSIKDHPTYPFCLILNSIVWVEETELLTNKYRYKIVNEKKIFHYITLCIYL